MPRKSVKSQKPVDARVAPANASARMEASGASAESMCGTLAEPMPFPAVIQSSNVSAIRERKQVQAQKPVQAVSPFDGLDLCADEKSVLRDLSLAFPKFESLGMGLNVVFSVCDLRAGVDSAIALANACGLHVNRMSLREAIFTEKPSLWDIEGRETRIPGETVLLSNDASERLTVLVDHEGKFGVMTSDHRKESIAEMTTFLQRLQKSRGVVVVVTEDRVDGDEIPSEYHRVVRVSLPSEESQMEAWQRLLPSDAALEMVAQLPMFVEDFPMTLDRIESTARKARAADILAGGDGQLSLGLLADTIVSARGRDRSGRSVAPLFPCQA